MLETSKYSVSVIIPCFNVFDFIEECLSSVFSQTYSNFEVICIDNGSTDETWNKLLELKTKYPSLHIACEEKPGANAARNKGISIAKGMWLQFLDADDLLMPTKIEEQMEFVRQNPTVDIVIAPHWKRAVNGTDTLVKNLVTNKFLATFINRSGNTCANLWKKQTIESVNGWDESLRSSQETDLMLRLVLAGAVFIIHDKPLTIIRERNQGQISQSKPVERLRQYVNVRIKYLTQLKNIFPEEYRDNENIFNEFLLNSIILLGRADPDLGASNYSDYEKRIKSITGEFGISKLKFRMIRIFGFKNYIRITSFLKKI